MPYVLFEDQRVSLTAAELTVGACQGAGLRLPGDDGTVRAVLTVGADGTCIARRGSADSELAVNGVRLGAEPIPLLHGDRLSVGSHELRYGDELGPPPRQARAGMHVPGSAGASGRVPKAPTAATGGRLVSLVDGREYLVPDQGATFGRDVVNDIVIASTDVSRTHARIVPGDGGYTISDLSTNGLAVNGVRVDKTQLLCRGDVLTIGAEEYRFYADVADPSFSAAADGSMMTFLHTTRG